MKKIIIAVYLLGLFSCIKTNKEESSTYVCSSNTIYYRSINNNPIFANAFDSSYIEIEFNILDNDFEMLAKLCNDCIAENDTSSYTVPTSSNTTSINTTVTIKNWNKVVE